MWVLFSLGAAFSFALVHVLDSHCVDEIFEKPWIGVVTSSIASIVVFQLIPFVGPFVSWDFPEMSIILEAFLSGVLIQTSQAFYFQSLAYSEAGIVAAYWNIIPALLPIATFFIYGKVLGIAEYSGIIILIIASIAMCLLDSNFEARWKSLFLMIFASLMQVVAYMLEDIVFDHSPFFLGFLIITIGLIFAGLAPLCLLNVRKIIIKSSKKLTSLLKLFILIEIVNLAALFLAQRAISIGEPSLVAAVENTMPAHVFMLTLLLWYTARKYSDKSVWHMLPYKISLVIVMIFGVWLLS